MDFRTIELFTAYALELLNSSRRAIYDMPILVLDMTDFMQILGGKGNLSAKTTIFINYKLQSKIAWARAYLDPTVSSSYGDQAYHPIRMKVVPKSWY